MAALVATAAWCILAYALMMFVFRFEWGDGGTVGNSSFLAAYLSLAIWPGLALGGIYIWAAGMIAVMLLHLGKITSLLGVGMSIAVWLAQRTQKPALIVTLAALLTIVGGFYGARLRSISGRIEFAMGGLAMIRDFPLGVGRGNFPLLFPAYDPSTNVVLTHQQQPYVNAAHNDILQIAIEASPLAAIVFLTALWMIFCRLAKARDPLCHALTLSAVAFLPQLVLNLPMEGADQIVPFWLILGMAWRMSSV